MHNLVHEIDLLHFPIVREEMIRLFNEEMIKRLLRSFESLLMENLRGKYFIESGYPYEVSH